MHCTCFVLWLKKRQILYLLSFRASFSVAIDRVLFSLSIRRFWGKRGKMEAKKGERWRRQWRQGVLCVIQSLLHPDFGCVTRFAEWFCVRPSFLFSPSPLPPPLWEGLILRLRALLFIGRRQKNCQRAFPLVLGDLWWLDQIKDENNMGDMYAVCLVNFSQIFDILWTLTAREL